MMRSLYSGVAGLKTHQTKMDVIGNNIANVNTTSYKSQSISFGDLLYQTTQAASGPNAATGAGGTNARQIGLGSKTGAISTAITTQGSAQTTNNPFDIMITGDSFFVVNNNGNNFFTRDGSFAVDGAGNLVMSSTGYNVMGWQADAEGNIVANNVSPLRVMSADNLTYPPEATTKGYVSGILDKNDTNVHSAAGKITSMSFFDELGYQYNAKFSIHALDGDAGKFYIKLDAITDTKGNVLDDVTEGASFGSKITIHKTPAPFSEIGDPTKNENVVGYYFEEVKGDDGNPLKDDAGNIVTVKRYGIFKADEVDANGKVIPKDDGTINDQALVSEGKTKEDDALLALCGQGVQDNYLNDKENKKNVTAKFDRTTGELSIEYDVEESGAMYLNYNASSGKFNGIGTSSTGLSAEDSKAMITFGTKNFKNIEVDFGTSSMFNNNGTSTISATRGDEDGYGTGRKIGEMSGVSISKDGIISASYDNGQTKVLGQIAVANFANAAGLEKAGDNIYSATMNSGEFDGIGVDITSGGGYMTTGVLEMSNVDLSSEFTEMITTQRGFQANSRIITTSDSLLEELVNLKR